MPRALIDHVVRVRLRSTREETYSLWIGHGISHLFPAAIRAVAPAERTFLVTDSRVLKHHGRTFLRHLEEAGLKTFLLTVPAGEASKSREEKAKLEDRLVALGAARDSVLLALGGGMVSDLVGFTAATYHRGIPFIPVPTTLLAMVDAALGGKTAVDHPRGKNLIGAFHQPRGVFSDVSFLQTLPDEEFVSGLAEVVKSAVIGDPRLFHTLETATDAVLLREPRTMLKLVIACCRVKARVVEADARDQKSRAVLNFGHTLGHALEYLLSYRLSHGHCVAIGMALEARAAEADGILRRGQAERIAALLEKLGLPTRLPEGVSPARILEAARRDKKTERGEIRYALPRQIGQMARYLGRYTIPLPGRLVLSVMEGKRPK